MTSSSFRPFNTLKSTEPNPKLMDLTRAGNDSSAEKMDMIYGMYFNEEGSVATMKTVEDAIQNLSEDNSLNHNYSLGSWKLCRESLKLFLGDDHPVITEGRHVSFQTIGGSDALRMASMFVKSQTKSKIHVTNEHWVMYRSIFTRANLEWVCLPYYDNEKNALNFEAYLASLKGLDTHSAVLYQPSCHNPTGCDLNYEQWKKILEVSIEKKFLVIFDSAYFGVNTGDIFGEVAMIRDFVDSGLDILILQSFSKVMGLYAERVGCIHAIVKDKTHIPALKNYFDNGVKSEFLCPVYFPGLVAEYVLLNNKNEWLLELKEMSTRLKRIRVNLAKALKENGTPGNWDFIGEQTGFFSYLGLTKEQMYKLGDDFHIYGEYTSRINIGGLPEKNIQRFADSIKAVIEQTS